ncbi:MAG: hypothetical protein K1000chlam1_01055 [Candidatus Anoxychlamydiales bacterium]|nr:hypothetical protein [Candidatus Anoxychlamydiales bacterium]
MSYYVKPLIVTSVAAVTGYATSNWKIGAATGLAYAAYEVINQCNKEQPRRRMSDHTYEDRSFTTSLASPEPRASNIDASSSIKDDNFFWDLLEQQKQRFSKQCQECDEACKKLVEECLNGGSVEEFQERSQAINEQEDNYERFHDAKVEEILKLKRENAKARKARLQEAKAKQEGMLG